MPELTLAISLEASYQAHLWHHVNVRGGDSYTREEWWFMWGKHAWLGGKIR